MAEAFYLLQKRSDMQAALLGMITMGVLKIPFRLEEEASAIAKLRTKYNSVPMSLADACLVRMSEVYPHHRVCTFDSHFKVYRKNVRDLIPVFMPNDAK
jgi:predicted nucleic acid-binding protein